MLTTRYAHPSRHALLVECKRRSAESRRQLLPLPKAPPDKVNKQQRSRHRPLQAPTTRPGLQRNPPTALRHAGKVLYQSRCPLLKLEHVMHMLLQQPQLLQRSSEDLGAAIKELVDVLQLDAADVVGLMALQPDLCDAPAFRLKAMAESFGSALHLGKLAALVAVVKRPVLLQKPPLAILQTVKKHAASLGLPDDVVVDMVLEEPLLLEVDSKTLKLRSDSIHQLLSEADSTGACESERVEARSPAILLPSTQHVRENLVLMSQALGLERREMLSVDKRCPLLLATDAGVVRDNLSQLIAFLQPQTENGAQNSTSGVLTASNSDSGSSLTSSPSLGSGFMVSGRDPSTSLKYRILQSAPDLLLEAPSSVRSRVIWLSNVWRVSDSSVKRLLDREPRFLLTTVPRAEERVGELMHWMDVTFERARDMCMDSGLIDMEVSDIYKRLRQREERRRELRLNTTKPSNTEDEEEELY